MAKERMENTSEMKCYDWFFCLKPLDKADVEKAILKK